jgi:murein DD-endopeptidase MepM/ murein hydrolase activator NlpD
MSPLHPDRLPTEGAAPAQGSTRTRRSASGTTSRRGSAQVLATAPVKAPVPVADSSPAQREGTLRAGSTTKAAGRARSAGTRTAKLTRTATAKAARTATATAKAASTRAAAVRAAATARKATAVPTAAEPATAKPATATAATAKAATAKAGTAKSAPAKATPAKSAAPKTPAAKTPAAKTPAAKTPTAKATSVKATSAAATPLVEAPAPPVRPTPYKRMPAAGPVLSLDGPVIEDVVLPAQAAVEHGRPALLRRRLPSVRRRPVLYLAAALVSAMSIGVASAGEPTADTTTVSASVSVAEQLGISAEQSAPIVDAETTDRLGDLVASRAERDAEQEQAAEVQAEADAKAAEEARLAAIAAAEAARPKAVLPVEGARLTSGFGPRWGTLHAGIDLAAPMRTPEYAAMDGVVLEAGPASGFGLAVYIQHENGDVTVYGHMDEILVTAGQVVKAGDTIALLGNRGQSTGPHLHFEVHQGGLDGATIDPVLWLRERGVKM